MGPGDLAQALCGLDLGDHPSVLVGPGSADDAGVYKLDEQTALVQTVDFFTPIVDDPSLFGQIAAVNAFSDVYAMGGKPLCAMNIVAFPVGKLSIEVLREILRGGLEVMREVGVPLVGGHSVDDQEVKYGLSVTGLVHPARIWTNRGARAGDRVILTKPLGTGVVSSALKRGQASAAAVAASVASMRTLNRAAAETLGAHGEVHACTDVTGFGLIGHACEMIAGSEVGLLLESGAIPLLPEALDYAARGLAPGGLKRNREFRQAEVDLAPGLAPALLDLLFDPQTSGGLLAAVPAAQAPELVERLHDAGVTAAAVVGEVSAECPGRIRVR